jgi:ABC-type sulfate transport system permease component
MQATDTKGLLRRHLLQIICIKLHVLLVLAHIALLISSMKHWEHHLTFPLDHQTTVSFWTTVITQAFGTVVSL